MSDNKAPLDNYEDVRDNYTEVLSKSAAFEKREIPKQIEKLREYRITVLDPKELLRIVFYLDDMMEHGELQEGTELQDWLQENMARNPSFFNRYFKQSKTVTLKKVENREEIAQEPKRNIIPDLSTSDQKTVDKIWDQPQENLVTLSESPPADDTDAEPPVEEFKPEYLIQTTLTDTVVAIQEQKRQEVAAQLQKIVESMMGVNFYDKPSLLAQLAESGAYKQLIVGIFSELGIKSPITSVTEHGVKEANLTFNANHSYSMEELRRGFAHAAIEIKRLAALEKANIDLEAKLRTSERSKLSINAEVTLLRSQNAELSKAQKLPAVNLPQAFEPKLLYCYIVWEEQSEESKEIKYLGTQDRSQISDSGFYLTKYLIKANRTDAIRFRTKKQAKEQLQRVIKNYKHINVKSKISLKGHLKQAKLLLLTEQEEIVDQTVEQKSDKADS